MKVAGKREQRKFTCYAKQEQVQAHSVWLNKFRRLGMYEQKGLFFLTKDHSTL